MFIDQNKSQGQPRFSDGLKKMSSFNRIYGKITFQRSMQTEMGKVFSGHLCNNYHNLLQNKIKNYPEDTQHLGLRIPFLPNSTS